MQTHDGDSKEHAPTEIAQEATRQAVAVISGPLAGVAVVVITGMLLSAKGSLDSALEFALVAFVIALPFLLLSFIFALTRTLGWSPFFSFWLGIFAEEVGITILLLRQSVPATVAFSVAIVVCLGWLSRAVTPSSRRSRKGS